MKQDSPVESTLKTTPFFIGITGPSGSGKSSIAEALEKKMEGAFVLSLDRYYRSLDHLTMCQRARVNFDRPEALDHEQLQSDLAAIKKGKAVELPVYLFDRHTRAKTTDFLPGNRQCLIIEGLYALYWPEVRALVDSAVFIDADPELCLQRRIARDVEERGRTEESVRRQFRRDAMPMFRKNVLPTRQYADLVLTGQGPVEDGAEHILEACRRRPDFPDDPPMKGV